MIYSALTDSAIRLATIVVRGVFIFAAAKYLSVTDFGLYVAISAVISLLQYAVAGDFSYIAHREFFLNRIKFDEMLKTQAILIVFLFIISIPFALFLLPSSMKKYFIVAILFILISEAVTSELQRHLAVISKFTRANLVLFIKSAGWMSVVLVMFVVDKDFRNLEFIINAWMIGLMVSVFVGLAGVANFIKIRRKFNSYLLKIYFKKVVIILIGTLATRALFSLDRIVVEKSIGVEQAGIYGLFVGIAAAFVAVLDAGVLTRSYPELVRVGAINPSEHKKISTKIQFKVALLTGAAILTYIITVPVFLSTIQKDEYLDYSAIGCLLIGAYGTYSISFPVNCRLYALGMDKLITAINLCSLTPFLTFFILTRLTTYQVALIIFSCAMLHYSLRQLVHIFYFRKHTI